jgi:predicted amidohydrolase YtcJ
MRDPLRPARLREAHAHIAQHGRARAYVDLSDCPTAADALARLAARADDLADARNDPNSGETSPGSASPSSASPGSDWLVATGARPESWPDTSGQWPALARLEDAVRGRPACVWCFDYHAILASGAAMRAAGLCDANGNATPDPAGGVIARNASGRATGVLLERAALALWDRVPEPTPEQYRDHVRAALADLASHGFVEVHDLKAQPWLGPMLGEMDRAGELSQTIWLYPLLDDAEAIARDAHRWQTDRVRLAGAKVFLDGTLNSRTAWMTEPFADGLPEHPCGTPMFTPREIEDAVRRADALGLPLAMHAIGDMAVRAGLDAIERVRPRTRGFRIEHAELVHERDVARFASLGVVCSVQPCHLLYDIEALRRAVPDRLDRVLPLVELERAGCRAGELLWFGSDVPIVRPHPEDSVLAATARRRGGMPAHEAINPGQAIDERAAWACFTPSTDATIG